MHEASLIEAVLERAEQEAGRAGATRIDRIRLRVGILSGVVPEALRFAFDALRQGTMAADATLEIDVIPARFGCLDCHAVSEHDTYEFVCPACGGTLIIEGGGHQLELAQLEVS
jgi:hydrogenase nickel incorporation protein HypA/HybF